MGAKEDFALCKPLIQRCVAFKLPEGKGSTDANVKTDGVAVVIVHTPVVWNADTVHILGEFFACWNVAFHHNGTKRRFQIDWEDGVLLIDFLEDLKEVAKEWLKRVIRDLFG